MRPRRCAIASRLLRAGRSSRAARWTNCARARSSRAADWRRSSCGSRVSLRRGISLRFWMPEVDGRLQAADGGLDGGRQTADGAALLPNPKLLQLLVPKVLTARARSVSDRKGRGVRVALLAVIGFLFWAFIFGLLYKLLVYFRGIPEIGPLLSGKLLGLMLVSFFSI